MRSGSSQISSLLILPAFSAKHLLYSGQPPDIKVRDNQDTVQFQKNTVRL